jgi:hypothetical protein
VALASGSAASSTPSEEKSTQYYNQQLHNRNVERTAQPTRASLSSSSFASKLLKAASLQRPEPRVSDSGISVVVKDQSGLVVQWLWRGQSSWHTYSAPDNEALEEAYTNDHACQQSILVDQGGAFVNIKDRVHVSLNNGMLVGTGQCNAIVAQPLSHRVLVGTCCIAVGMYVCVCVCVCAV